MTTLPTLVPASIAEQLNRGCACRFLDQQKLQQQLEQDPALHGLAAEIAASRPHLFSATMVFITQRQKQQMQQIISAVERVVALAGWQQQALAQAPAIARLEHGPHGVFFGYDFHLGDDGPQLIEINTNAGGAILNHVLANAQTACCSEIQPLLQAAGNDTQLPEQWLQMFWQEWRSQRQSDRPQSIAIVDEAPTTQYLYPEFQLFQRLFQQAGAHCVISAPEELRWQDGQLWHGDRVIDLVYNRLTDFYLEQPQNLALQAAYQAGAVVLTPHPRAHALYADKRHLIQLSNPSALSQLGLDSASCDVLQAGVPATRLVDSASADDLWTTRKQWFFKPRSGFGSRATYRGDKLTQRVWQEILAGDYVAQRIAVPSQRLVAVEDSANELKLDVRAYVYRGEIQLLAARLYNGQTTNFRTPGGGFAPVFVIPE